MTEADIQTGIVEYLRWAGILVFSCPNEIMGHARTKGGLARMARFKRMGLMHGVADLIALLPGGKCLFMEVKTDKGRQSDHQKTFQTAAHALGFRYDIVKSIDQVKAIIEQEVKR